MARHVALLLTALVALAACQAGEPGTAGADEAVQVAQPGAEAPASATPAEGVTVVGHGRVTGEPDTLRATVGVQVARSSVEEAFEDAARAADEVLAVVDEHGVADEDVQTREFSVRPQQEHRPDQPPVVTGYVVRNLVEVTIREIDAAGELLAAVTDAAGDDARVEGVNFSLEDNDAQLRAAREEAFADARAKAEHYAELADATLGDLVSVTELAAQLPPPVPVPAEAAGAADTAAPPVMPGEQEVGVQLQATWALQ